MREMNEGGGDITTYLKLKYKRHFKIYLLF